MTIQLFLATLMFACTPARAPQASDDPDRKATRAECEASVDHAIALFDAEASTKEVAAQMRRDRASVVGQCESTALLHDHRCLMKARTAADMGTCPMPGTPSRGGAK